MLDKLKNTLNHWLEPQTVTVGEAVAQWTKVSQLKPGMKIAVFENSHPGGAPSVTLGVALDSPGVEWDEIASIKEVGRERVYDIEIDGTRNFVAGHYINQNTGKALTTQQEAAYSEYLTTKKSACADSGDSTNVGSNLDCHLDSNLQQQRNFVNTQNKGVEVAGFAPAEPWVTIQVPHLGTPTPSPLSQILGEDINDKNIIYGGIIAPNTTTADTGLGYNFQFGSGGVTLSTSGTSGLNIDTFGQLSLTTNQGAANALELVSTAGGIDISTGSGTADIDILGGDAINLKAGTNGINLSAGTPTHGSGLLVNSSGDVQIGTNTLFADVSAGNVGIGTTVPGGILHTKSNDLGVILQTSSGTTKRMQTIYQDSAGTQTGRIGVDISGANDDDLQFVAGSGTTPMLHIEADGNVGIGDDTPDALLDVNGDLNVGTTTVVVTSATGDIVAGDSSSVLDWDASNQALYLQHSEADAVGLTIRSRKSRGSLASPTVITSGDYLLLINGYGYDGTAWEESSRIMLDTEGTVSTGIVPGIMRFYTQSTAGALTERMTIDSAGNVGIGDNSPTEAELVIGSAGAGSIYLTLSTAGTTNNAVCWDNA